MVNIVFAILCVTCLPLSLQQVVPAPQQLSEFCHVSQEDLRVLPSAGFSRSVLKSFTSTTTAGAQPTPIPFAANLSGCLFQSYDPKFDALIGNNRTLYQVGPSRSQPWAVESPAYLPGTPSGTFDYQVCPHVDLSIPPAVVIRRRRVDAVLATLCVSSRSTQATL